MLQVTNSPFNQEQADLLNRLLPSLNDVQRAWLSGYIMALDAKGASAVMPQATAAAPAVSKEVTVLYGSQTGNSQKLANALSKKLVAQGFQVTVSSMGDFKPNTMKKVENLFIVVSTHGEGEPPDNALSFYEFLHSKRAPKLDELRYSVLALGDTSYEFFCQTGKDFDKRLEELGGKRIVPRADCDVDFEDAAAEWMNHVLASLAEPVSAGAPVQVLAGVAPIAGSIESEFTKTNPFQAPILENLNLNGRGSKRETRHVEISLEGSNLQYEPGDCVGIYPKNHPRLVEEIIKSAGLNAEESVPFNKNGDQCSLLEALTSHFEITVLTKPLFEQAAKLFGSDQMADLLKEGREQELREYLKGRDLLDLLQEYRLDGVSGKDLVSILRKMPPRLYSISSSLKANPDEVHVTVRKVEYEAYGRQRYGVCSTYLSDRLSADDTLPIYIHQNPNFKLPSNPDTPVIMIGPGTGVAPFRAFLGEREELGAEGQTWLFYGDQHFSTDFLYQVEWQRWLKDGVLTRMDVAFSRDTKEKVYVQHRMLEKSKDFYSWLQAGAHVYVCGDEKNMAHDVHAALHQILETEGGMTPEQAVDYVKQMQQDKRYQRDVY